MSTVTTAHTAVLKTEAKLFRREPGALFWLVVFPSALLTILGLIPAFREPGAAPGGLRVIDLYVPVAVLLALSVAGVQTMPAQLTGYRERGILRRLSTTPARPSSLLLASLVLHAVVVLGSVLLALAIGRLAFGVALPAQPAGYVLALLITAFAAFALGCALAAVPRTVKAAQTLGTVVFFPMMFTAGVWIPVQSMPETLRHLVEWSPLGAASQALGQAAAGHWPSWSHLGVTGLWAVLLLTVAARRFRWE
ncbi:ABC transporter permease [Streptomyces benahoarensis]|uniref:Transport permease protein n=1 Tax=Streptomyces benahoarensis TaxID=2595054 RepID=A0A553ZND8_9ACTN|nr:ABC transporter permease [Streptomyces benahoarensis]TSB25714.1 ABC transporter permease [Streptomyces benahoarensis]TSB42962.1 ABC transporter permease [Streptomyces benahoarensis]